MMKCGPAAGQEQAGGKNNTPNMINKNICPVCSLPGRVSFCKSGVGYIVCPGCKCCYAACAIPSAVTATSNDGGAKRNSPESNREVLRRIEEKHTPRLVLDFGCGRGEISELICREKKYQVIPIDRHTRIKLSDIENSSVDTIIMREVIEHVPRPVYLFERFSRLLGERGLVYVETSFTDHMPDLEGSEYVDPGIDHCLIHSRKSLETLAGLTGFTVNWAGRNAAFLLKGWKSGQQQLEEMYGIAWWHRIELAPGIYTPGEVRHGADGSNYEEARFGLPADLTGKSVLDIGGWDGYFSFACEKRNAEKIVLCDVPAAQGGNWGGTAGFNFAKKILNSKVEFVELSANALTPEKTGMFDITLLYGVLNHLESLLPALKAACSVTREYTLLETALLPGSGDKAPEAPLAGFFQGSADAPTHYWYPNLECLKRLLLCAGYKSVELLARDGDRVTVKANK